MVNCLFIETGPRSAAIAVLTLVIFYIRWLWNYLEWVEENVYFVGSCLHRDSIWYTDRPLNHLSSWAT